MPRDEKPAPIRIELTADQQKIVREATGKNAQVLEFSIDELEERISPTGVVQQ